MNNVNNDKLISDLLKALVFALSRTNDKEVITVLTEAIKKATETTIR